MGGGSGGHITPLLAVARELKALQSDIQIVYIGEKNGKFSHIAENSQVFDKRYYVSAGKLRRYHNESLLRRVTDIKTISLNVRDAGRLVRGFVQANRLMKHIKPDAALMKGGYVCVPVSLAARRNNVPIITHDSDALPGLSNRFAAQYSRYHATAMPAKYYSYPSSSVRVVGLPVDATFRPYTQSEQRFLKEKYNIPAASKVLLITGGSNGAQRLNEWCIKVLPDLLGSRPNLHVVHIYGAGNEHQYDTFDKKYMKRITRLGFTDELFHYSAIADVIITRAGATTLAEFAAQAKACIVVPNPDLTGGHQLKNAQVYKDLGSVVVVTENQLRQSEQALQEAVQDLLDDAAKRQKLGAHLHRTLPKKPAAKALAELLVEVAGRAG